MLERPDPFLDESDRERTRHASRESSNRCNEQRIADLEPDLGDRFAARNVPIGFLCSPPRNRDIGQVTAEVGDRIPHLEPEVRPAPRRLSAGVPVKPQEEVEVLVPPRRGEVLGEMSEAVAIIEVVQAFVLKARKPLIEPAPTRQVPVGDADMSFPRLAGKLARERLVGRAHPLHVEASFEEVAKACVIGAVTALVPLLDGTRTVQQIVVERFQESGDMELDGVADLVRELRQGNFLTDRFVDVREIVKRAADPISRTRAKAREFVKTLSVDWAGAHRLVEWLYRRLLRHFFRPAVAASTTLIAVVGLVAFFAEYDLLLTPTLAERPLAIGECTGYGDDPMADFARSGRFTPFTSLFNVTGQPAISVPLGFGDDGLPTAVQLVNGFNGLGVHTLLSTLRFFPGLYKQFVFVSVAVVDSGSFKGKEEIDALQRQTEADLAKYVRLARGLGFPAESITGVGTEVLDEATELCAQVSRKYPKATIITGRLVFRREHFFQGLLHNETPKMIQQRLQWLGVPMVILPIRATV